MMSQNRVLVFSSSRSGKTGYLETAAPLMKDFLGDKMLNIAFIPFASVTNDYDQYASIVKKGLESLPCYIDIVTPTNSKEVMERAEVILVGGGNTFKLLHDLYEFKLLDIIRDKVDKGTPYIGWSAGANITSPTIGTTNDMPVIEPKSFNALGLLPFQINPHYTNAKPLGHHGETRDQRLEEFIQMNPGIPVIGLPEGASLKLENSVLTYFGQLPAVLFYKEIDDNQVIQKTINELDDLSFLL